jgi:hypothetical protein
VTNNLQNFQISFQRFIDCLKAFETFTAQLAIDEPVAECEDLSTEEEILVNQLWDALADEPLFELIPPVILSALESLEQSKHPVVIQMIDAMRTSLPMVCELCTLYLKIEELKSSLTLDESQAAQEFANDILAANSSELNETYDDLLDAFALRQSKFS